MILHFSALKDKFGQKAKIQNMMYRYFPLMLKKSAKIVFITYGRIQFWQFNHFLGMVVGVLVRYLGAYVGLV